MRWALLPRLYKRHYQKVYILSVCAYGHIQNVSFNVCSILDVIFFVLQRSEKTFNFTWNTTYILRFNFPHKQDFWSDLKYSTFGVPRKLFLEHFNKADKNVNYINSKMFYFYYLIILQNLIIKHEKQKKAHSILFTQTYLPW